MEESGKRPIIKLTQEAKSKLTILAKRSGTTELNFASRSIMFIYQSSIDIFAKSQPYIPDLVKNLERRIIGFMKKREADFFIPMNEKVMALTHSHVRLFDALEALDVVRHASDKLQDNTSFANPESDPSPTKDLEAYKKQNEAEKQQMKLQLAKAKRQSEIFKNELEFLMGSISRAGALSKSKFMLSITQRDCQRIRRTLLDDN